MSASYSMGDRKLGLYTAAAADCTAKVLTTGEKLHPDAPVHLYGRPTCGCTGTGMLTGN